MRPAPLTLLAACLLATCLLACGGGSGGRSDSPSGSGGGAVDAGGTVDAGGAVDAGGQAAGDAGGARADAGGADAGHADGGTSDAGHPDGGAGATHRLTLHVVGAGAGRVVSSPPGIDCTSDCAADFKDGETVTLTAVPAGSSSLLYWVGPCNPRGTSCSFKLAPGEQWDGALDHDVSVAFEVPAPFRYAPRLIEAGAAADAIDSAGDVAYTVYGASGPESFVRRSATGISTRVGHGRASALNDSGDLAITLWDASGTTRAGRYHAGQLQDLQLGPHSASFGINGNGVVAGSYHPPGDTSAIGHAFLSDGRGLKDLGVGVAFSINDAGVAVGNAGSGGAIFQDGTVKELSTPRLQVQNAFSISNRGFIAGDGPLDGVIRPPGGEFFHAGVLPAGKWSTLVAVNDDGVAVGLGVLRGRALKYRGGDEIQRAVVYRGGRLWDLAFLIGDATAQIGQAVGINARGEIVASAIIGGVSGAYAFSPE